MSNKDSKKIKKIEAEVLENQDDDAVIIDDHGLDVKKTGNVVIGTLNVFTKPIKDRHEKHYKESFFHLVADIVLVLIIIALIFGNFFISLIKPEPDLSLEIKSILGTISSGEVEKFEISYENKSEDNIAELKLALKIPENMKVVSVVPDTDLKSSNNTIELGNLAGGSNGKVILEAEVFASIGATQVINAYLNYKINDKNKQVVAKHSYTIEESVVNMTEDFPKEIYEGNTSRLKFKIKNNGINDIKNLKIACNVEGLQLIEVIDHSRLSLDGNTFVVPELLSEEERNIEIIIKALTTENASIELEAFQMYKNKEYLQDKLRSTMHVVEPKLKVSILSRNEALEDSGAKFNLLIENKEDLEVEDLQLRFYSTNDKFEITDLKLNKKSFTLKENTVYIGDVLKSESLQANLDIGYRSVEQYENAYFSVYAIASFKIDSERLELTSTSKNLKVPSEVNIRSSAYYYSEEGDQLGVGPLPPKVGIPTSYWIIWRVDNNGNELSDLSVSAELGPEVLYFDRKSVLSGKLEYSESTNRIAWHVPNVAKTGASDTVKFEISIIPSPDMTGQIPVLLKSINYSASDNFTNTTLNGYLGDIDIDLDNSTEGSGNRVEN